MENNVKNKTGGCAGDNLQDTEKQTAKSCSRRWFSDARLFVLIYSLIWLSNGAFFSYIVGAITTIEKRFQFPSKQSGLLISINEFFHLFLVVFVSYFGGKSHKPRVLGVGCGVLALGVFILTVPHYVYGAGPRLRVNNTGETITLCNKSHSIREFEPNEECEEEATSNRNAFWILCLGKALFGIGGASLYALGASYIDDNADKQASVLYLGFAFAMRVFGPVVGMILSGLCASLYITPTDPPSDMTPWDPQWIGAYWLGFLILSLLMAILSVPMAMFPRSIRNVNKEQYEEENKSKYKDNELIRVVISKPKELVIAIKKLLTNPVYVGIALGACVDMHAVTGYFVWLPKYIETQFNQPVFGAAIAAALSTLLPSCLGYFIGSAIINRLKLTTKGILLIILVGNFIFGTLGGILPMFLGCDQPSFEDTLNGRNFLSRGLRNPCNHQCKCSEGKFIPICDSNGVSFFSPCHAGCTGSTLSTDFSKNFTDCACAQEPVVGGLCSEECQLYPFYIAVTTIKELAASPTQIALIMATIRSVAPDQKPLALGLSSFLISALAFMPGPIIAGSLVDRACTLWQKNKCDKTGACLLYDNTTFRFTIHGLVAFVKLGSCIFYFMAYRKCGGTLRERNKT